MYFQFRVTGKKGHSDSMSLSLAHNVATAVDEKCDVCLMPILTRSIEVITSIDWQVGYVWQSSFWCVCLVSYFAWVLFSSWWSLLAHDNFVEMIITFLQATISVCVHKQLKVIWCNQSSCFLFKDSCSWQ